MGRSVYGIVTCGIDFGGELPEVFQKYMEDSEEDYFDFEEFLCHEAGHFYSTDLTDEKRGVWFKRREEIIETCPVEIVIHGWGMSLTIFSQSKALKPKRITERPSLLT